MIRKTRPSDFGDNLIKEYIDIFSASSINNQLYGKVSLHVLLGQALKNVHYRIGSRKIDIRSHLLLIKPQGTGKGAGYGFVRRVAKGLGLNFKHLTESTDGGLAGSHRYNAKTGQDEVIPGVLEDADIVGMEEASVLFDYTSDFSKKNMTFMQITMNPLNDASCNITRDFVGQTVDFKPHASFILLTYPPDKLAEKLLKTGFFDRVIPIFEDVTLIDRLEVIKRIGEMTNVSTEADFKEREKWVIRLLETIVEKYKGEDLCITIPKKIHKRMLLIINEFAMKILDASPKAREKLEHFISRLYEQLMKLAIHHALLSKRSSLEVSDILYARLTYLPIWRNLIISIESLLIISPIERARRYRIIRTSLNEYDEQIKIGKFVKDKVWVRRLTMVENLRSMWDNCTMETADNNLRKLERIPEIEFSKVSKYEKDKYFERRNIGDVAYLKKVRNIK